jgi:hypothetical protein
MAAIWAILYLADLYAFGGESIKTETALIVFNIWFAASFVSEGKE